MHSISLPFIYFAVIVIAETQDEFLSTFNENHIYDYQFTPYEKNEGLTYRLQPEYIDQVNYINGRKFGPRGNLMLPQLNNGYFYVSSEQGKKIYFNLPRWVNDHPIDHNWNDKKKRGELYQKRFQPKEQLKMSKYQMEK